uniref:Uncharacterized protein n=1 Tax=Amphimedon queenslandica TaxID=400682 RepID=A0A1X7UMV1_AMPQE
MRSGGRERPFVLSRAFFAGSQRYGKTLKNPPVWFQGEAGSFYPFFRAHAHIDTKRREPYLMDEENRNVIHEALRLRYKLLPYWYTLFYQSHISGLPVARPLWLEFPRDKNTYNIEDQIMI